MFTTLFDYRHSRFRLILLFSAFFFFFSCAPYHDIEVKDWNIDKVSMQGSKIIVDFSAVVKNPNRAFVLHSASGDLHLGEKPFAEAQLIQPITIFGKSEERCSGGLKLNVTDLIAAFQMGIDYKTWDYGSFLFTGDFQIKSAWFKRKFKYNKVPLNQLINQIQL